MMWVFLLLHVCVLGIVAATDDEETCVIPQIRDVIQSCDVPQKSCGCCANGECFYVNSKEADWNTAVATCASAGGYLLDDTIPEAFLSVAWPDVGGSAIWTALAKDKEYYQWTGRNPEYAHSFDRWPWHPAEPDKLNGRCTKLLRPTEMLSHPYLHTEKCSSKLPFVCVMNEDDVRFVQDSNHTGFKNVRLRVTSSVADDGDGDGLVLVDSAELDDLSLRCEFPGGEPPPRVVVTWVKDDVIVGADGRDPLYPATVSATTRWPSDKSMCRLQGVFWCEARVPGIERRLRSNRMLVTLSHFVNVVGDMTRYVDRTSVLTDDGGLEVARFLDVLSQRTGIPLGLVSEWHPLPSEYSDIPGSNIIARHRFRMCITTKIQETASSMLISYVAENGANRLLKELGYFANANLHFPTVCLNLTERHSTAMTKPVSWPIALAGVVSPPSDGVCFSKGRVVTRKCTWGSFRAQWSSFSINQCESNYPTECPVGYEAIPEKTGQMGCRLVTSEGTWQGAYNKCLMTGRENFDYHLTRVHLNRTVWLPFKRMWTAGPLYHVDRRRHELRVDDIVGSSWEIDQPDRQGDCLTIDLATKKLSTRNCNDQLSIVCFLTIESNINWKQHTCPPGWVSPFGRMCYKSVDGSMTRSSAVEQCRNLNATLPHVDSLFSQKLLAPFLQENRTLWLDMEYVGGTVVSHGHIVDPVNVKWHRPMFAARYAVLSDKGVSFSPGGELAATVCQKPALIPPPPLIHVNGNNDLSAPDGFTCYVNGRKTHRDLISEQGYYQCSGFDELGYYVESNVVAHRGQCRMFVVEARTSLATYQPLVHDATYSVDNDTRKALIKYLNRYPSIVPFSVGPFNYSRYMNHSHEHLQMTFALCPDNQNAPSEEIQWQMLRNGILPPGFELEIPGGDTMVILDVYSTNACPRETVTGVLETWRGGKMVNVTWPRTIVGQDANAEELCLDSSAFVAKRACVGDFNSVARWADPPVTCDAEPTDTTLHLWKDYQNNHLPDIDENEKIQPVDVDVIVRILEKLPTEMELRHDRLSRAADVVNHLLDVNMTTLNDAQENKNTTSRLLHAVESMTISTVGDVHIDTEHVTYQILQAPNIVGFASYPHKIEALHTTDIDDDATSAILLPTAMGDNDTISFVVFKNTSIFDTLRGTNSTFILNSVVMQANMKNTFTDSLSTPVKIMFKPRRQHQKQRTTDNDTNLQCVYWDFALNSWSTRGCRYAGTEDGMDVCLCDHLTSFAEILSFYDDGFEDVVHRAALGYITTVGCCVSIMCLSFVFATFLLFPKWRKPLGNRIITSLALALFMLYAMFLGGVEQTDNEVVCIVVAVALHYFTLAAFCWMLVEAYHQYLRFVRVIGTYIPRFMRKAALFAWGTPLFPVVGVLAYDHASYNTAADYCWMTTGPAFIYAFLLPVFTILAVNTGAFFLITYNIYCCSAKLRSNQKQRHLAVLRLRMSLCVFVLLGLSWLFSAFAIGDVRLTFSYLSCIFNTLQGFFIFIFHIVYEPMTKHLWRSFVYVYDVRSRQSSTTHDSSTRRLAGKTGSPHVPILPHPVYGEKYHMRESTCHIITTP